MRNRTHNMSLIWCLTISCFSWPVKAAPLAGPPVGPVYAAVPGPLDAAVRLADAAAEECAAAVAGHGAVVEVRGARAVADGADSGQSPLQRYNTVKQTCKRCLTLSLQLFLWLFILQLTILSIGSTGSSWAKTNCVNNNTRKPKALLAVF